MTVLRFLYKIELLEPDVAVISRICDSILNRFASWVQPYFGVHIPLEEPRNIYQSRALDLLQNCLTAALCLDKMVDVNSVVKQRWFDQKCVVYAQISD